MPFVQGRNRVKITAIELTKLKEKDGDDNRYGVVITGKLEDGSTMDGWMYINSKVGKDEKTGYQRTLENLTAIGLPDNNLMNLGELVGKECSFSCEFEEDEDGYASKDKKLRVQFINPCRVSCSQDEIAAMMCHFTGGSMPQPVQPPAQQTQMPAPQFYQPPVQNTGVYPQTQTQSNPQMAEPGI